MLWNNLGQMDKSIQTIKITIVFVLFFKLLIQELQIWIEVYCLRFKKTGKSLKVKKIQPSEL